MKVNSMNSIKELEKEIDDLRSTLKQKENALAQLRNTLTESSSSEMGCLPICGKLPKWAIERYSRQILLSEIGVPGQLNICKAKVLVVGAGGLGCPAAAYLAGAGVGEIGIVDYDTVDVTNIHRQLLHSELDQDVNKVTSAADALKRINSKIKVTEYHTQLRSENALGIISGYDVVLDCTDNVPTRYLLNDACVLAKVPLISGSALKMEGQLTVYNYIGLDGYAGLCYRCIFPVAPPAETVGSCSAQGVCGPIPGTIGTLQSLEAIKLIVGFPKEKLLVGRMMLFDGDDLSFRVVKLRQKNVNCDVCSINPKITQLIDYELFCRSKAIEKELDLNILSKEQRITAKELHTKLQNADEKTDERPLLVDVRTESEFQMCHIDGSVNFSIEKIDQEKEFDEFIQDLRSNVSDVIFICRRGNDSQIFAKKVIDYTELVHRQRVKDLFGGLRAWAKEVDCEFPIY